MMRFPTLRFALALPLITAAVSLSSLHAQISDSQRKPSAALPPTAPTSFVATTSPTPSATLTPAQRPAHRAEVKFANGELAVTADNSSLNQILREIGRTTGIKITGGVADERVFGKYGPSPAADVLDALLDGTGSNMLLVQTDDNSELILTPRHGGVTPPNPNAPGFDDDSPSPDDPQPAAPRPAVAPIAPNQTPGAAPAQPNVQSGVQVAQPDAQAAPATATDATDPNAVKTPQQIFEQLQKLRQQQQQQTPPQ